MILGFEKLEKIFLLGEFVTLYHLFFGSKGTVEGKGFALDKFNKTYRV
jgi:hypothetical protein